MTKSLQASTIAIAITSSILSAFTLELRADDWPQWRGENRDGVWRESGIVESIPRSGLKYRWRVKIGRGYSGPVVANGRVFVTDQVFKPELERVVCFDESSGRSLWSHSYPVDYENMEYGNGPRASPTVHAGRVYTLGTQGDLCCLDSFTGELFWQKDLAKEYDAQIPQYGASVAPLVEGDLLIVCIGGQPEASVIAFDRISGEEKWTALDDDPAYSAPIVVEQGGHRQAIVWTADNVVSLNPTTGEVYWKERWKAGFDAAQVVATPVLHEDRLLFVMAWNRGSKMLKLDSEKPTASLLWRTRSRPTTSMATPIMLDADHFYSIENASGLCCLDANTGDEVWKTTEVAGSSPLSQAHMTPFQHGVFLFNQRGHLITARLSPQGYKETGRTLLVEPRAAYRAQGPVTWAHPAYANKHVVARNDRELVCASLDAAQYTSTKLAQKTMEVKSQILSDLTGRSSALTLGYSPDGQTLACGLWSGSVKLLDISNGEEQSPAPTSFRNNCCDLAFSPDGHLVAYVGGSEFEQGGDVRRTAKVHVWSMSEGKLLHDLPGHQSQVTCVAFSPDGRMFATGSADKTIRLWETATGEEQAVLKGHTDAVWSLVYAPDGKTLVTAGWDRSVKFWNAEISVLNSPVSTRTTRKFSDGRHLPRRKNISNRQRRLDGAVVESVIKRIVGHSRRTQRLGLLPRRSLPTGSTLASGSGDETVKLWDVSTAKAKSTLTGHLSGISDLTFSSDGKSLASAGRDDPVRIWTLKE